MRDLRVRGRCLICTWPQNVATAGSSSERHACAAGEGSPFTLGVGSRILLLGAVSVETIETGLAPTCACEGSTFGGGMRILLLSVPDVETIEARLARPWSAPAARPAGAPHSRSSAGVAAMDCEFRTSDSFRGRDARSMHHPPKAGAPPRQILGCNLEGWTLGQISKLQHD